MTTNVNNMKINETTLLVLQGSLLEPNLFTYSIYVEPNAYWELESYYLTWSKLFWQYLQRGEGGVGVCNLHPHAFLHSSRTCHLASPRTRIIFPKYLDCTGVCMWMHVTKLGDGPALDTLCAPYWVATLWWERNGRQKGYNLYSCQFSWSQPWCWETDPEDIAS